MRKSAVYGDKDRKTVLIPVFSVPIPVKTALRIGRSRCLFRFFTLGVYGLETFFSFFRPFSVTDTRLLVQARSGRQAGQKRQLILSSLFFLPTTLYDTKRNSRQPPKSMKKHYICSVITNRPYQAYLNNTTTQTEPLSARPENRLDEQHGRTRRQSPVCFFAHNEQDGK